MVYSDYVPVDTSSGSYKSLQRFILILFQLKIIQDLCWFSLNRSKVYPDTLSVDTFSGSDKSLQRFILIFYPVKYYSRPLSVQFKSINGLS